MQETRRGPCAVRHRVPGMNQVTEIAHERYGSIQFCDTTRRRGTILKWFESYLTDRLLVFPICISLYGIIINHLILFMFLLPLKYTQDSYITNL